MISILLLCAALPYVALSFDYGHVGNSLFWVVLALWSFVITGVIYNKRRGIGAFVSSAFSRSADTRKTREYQYHPIQRSERSVVYEPTIEERRQARVQPPLQQSRVPLSYDVLERSSTPATGTTAEIMNRAERALIRSRNAQEGLPRVQTQGVRHVSSVAKAVRPQHAVHADTHSAAPVRPIEHAPQHTQRLQEAPHKPHAVAQKPAPVRHDLHAPVSHDHAHSDAHHDHKPEMHAEVVHDIHAHEPVYGSEETYNDTLTLEKEKDGTPKLVLVRSKK